VTRQAVTRKEMTSAVYSLHKPKLVKLPSEGEMKSYSWFIIIITHRRTQRKREKKSQARNNIEIKSAAGKGSPS